MLENLIDAAFEYTFPLHAIATTRYRALHDRANPRPNLTNTWQHERQLADHTTRWITAPNNDTLYSNAWLDLSRGPVTLRAQAMPAGRYWSVAMMDAFGNHFGIVGLGQDGAGPVEVTLVGPHWRGNSAGRIIRAPGQDAWLFARCLVDGPADLPIAHAMQDGLSLQSVAVHADEARIVPGLPTDAPNFLDVVNESLVRNPVPSDEADMLAGWAVIGVRPGHRGVWYALPPEVQAIWRERIVAAYSELRQAGMKGRRQVEGWVTAGPEIGNFGRNYALRASVALGGLGALEPTEAIYFVRFHDENGDPLDGRQSLVMTVPPSGIPTDSFWSFSMYEPVAGQRFFSANPLTRYSLGNRTAGLVYNADGSLDIALSHARPTELHLLANWLPAPAGPFQISLRCYRPRPHLRELQAPMPRLKRYPLDSAANLWTD